ncbi:glycoside hydrolase domain-containing protein [Nocardioides plantarum]|uniref:Glycoside hydrolase domain-containing protein n=1 Tax=Nocardioides plantarum TaxID=29299 RepID=A0ABV5KFK6_9ACTN|nr:glycoside hydrolase domain-containing protein [Nocardioides plantarum]
MITSPRRGSRTPRLVPTALATSLAAALAVGGLASTAPAGAATTAPAAAAARATTDYTDLVNPFMSTQGDNGQNIPGAQVPHGLAKPNPMTAPGRTHSGYDYAQGNIRGFTLTNLDGVGGSGGGGDLLVVPTYTGYTARPASSTYALPFSHDDESAEPGYYQVGLKAPQGTIEAELTATVRSGLERFTFPTAGKASLVLDLQNNFTGRLASDLAVEKLADGRAELFGSVTGTFNGYNYKLYYDAVTSAPVTSVKTWGEGAAFGPTTRRTGTDTGAVMTFDVTAGQAVQLTTTLSPVSIEQARRDQAAELTGKSFDEVRAAAHEDWQETLGKVAVTSDATSDPDGDIAAIFYTSLYRMLATPTNATSTDGTYRGVDGAVHRADGYTHYDGWGTWDDFRKYSVLATTHPDLYADVVQSLVDIYADDANVGNATLSSRTMAVPTVRFERSAIVIADAVSKGVHLDRLAQAFPALVANANTYNAANQALGYIAGDPGTTVATSYDDYALSVIATELGRTADAATYKSRSANYRNVLKPKAWTAPDGTDVSVLSSRDASGAFAADDLEQFQAAKLYQGTLWQFHWYPAQDMAGLVAAMGGTDAARKALSHYFGEQAPDDGTKMLKSNANEVDLQTPYLFNYLGQPAKTQKWVRDLYTKQTWQQYIATGGTDGNNPPSSNGKLTPPIKTKVFKNEPLGFLPTMDDDTGAMSATYVAAALGLYPVTAGSSQYQVGSPFFPRVDISHDDGTAFSIVAKDVSPDRFYIQDATLDGKAYGNTWVDYDDIAGDGSFDVTMGAEASTWGTTGAPAFSLSTAGAGTPAAATATSDRTTLTADAAGAVDGTITMTLKGATLAGADGDVLTTTGRATVTGLPDGVTVTVTRTSATTLAVKVSGTLAAQRRTRFAVRLTDAALVGTTAAAVTGTGLSTRDPFTILVTDHWRDALRDSYEEARLVVAGNWEGSTYAALVTARASARTVLADATATDAEIDGADAALTAALDGLTLSQGGYRRLEAEKHDLWSGGADLHDEPTGIGGVRPGAWIAFNGVSFSGGQVPDQVQVRYSGAVNDGYANAAVEVRLGAVDGPLLATVATPPTASGFGTYATATADLTGVDALLAAAPATVYFVFRGSNPTSSDTTPHWVGNVDFMQFAESGATEEPVENDVVLTPDGRAGWGGDGVSVGSGTLKTETDQGSAGPFTAIANTHNGDWVKWAGADLSGAPTRLSVHYVNNSNRVAPDANLDVYLDTMTGTPLVNVKLPATGTAWTQDGYATVDLPQVTGTHDVYLVMHGTYTAERPYVGNLGDLTFVIPDAPSSDGLEVQFENRTSWTGPELKTESFSWNDGTSGTNVGGTHDGDVLEYDALRFADTATSLSVHYVNNSSRVGNNSRIEVYLDARTGTPLVTVPLPVTGSAWSNAGTTKITLPTAVSGTHKVILVLRTDVPDANHPFVSNLDSFTFNYGVDKTALQRAYDGYAPRLAETGRYVRVDLRAFSEAMAVAQDVLADDTATGSDVSGALRTLQLAGGQLAPRAQRSLLAAVSDARELDLTRYTQKTGEALTAALGDSTAMLTAATATDEQYAAQAATLEGAIDALELKVTSVPDAPQAVSATGVGQRITVAWAAPAYDGNSPVTGYLVQLEGGDPVTVPADRTSYTFTGLERGRSYRATVKAVNALGTSAASAYTAYVPVATTPPSNPARPGISAVGQAVTVTWVTPDDGGSTITGYTVRLSAGTVAQVEGTATSHTFTGLAAGTYTATVAATNVAGTSPASPVSERVTVLPAPTVTKVTATAQTWSQVQVGWRTTAGSERFVVKVSLTRGGRVVASRQAWSDASGVRFTGLAAATSYGVSVTPVGGDTAARTTVRTPARPKVVAHAVQIKGKAKVGATLSVDVHHSSWSSGTRFAYQWRVEGKIVGWTSRLKVKSSFAGRKITVRVTGTRGDWTPTAVTSKAVRVAR